MISGWASSGGGGGRSGSGPGGGVISGPGPGGGAISGAAMITNSGEGDRIGSTTGAGGAG